MTRGMQARNDLAQPASVVDGPTAARWLDENGHLLVGAGVWTLGGEPNTDPAEAFDARRLRVLVARLSTYRDVATSTSHGVVAELFRRAGDVFCDFAYLPPGPDRPRLVAAHLPLWFGTTTRRPPRDFDLLALSVSVAQELINLPHLLAASGIPLGRTDRLADLSLPLVLLGGAAASHTSTLHGDVTPGKGGLVDAVLVGEAEAILPSLVPLLERGRAERWGKSRILREALHTVPGFYDPSLYEQRFGGTPARLVEVRPRSSGAPFPVTRGFLTEVNAVPEPTRLPLPHDADGCGTARLRISFGCPFACSFCQEGWDQKPYRERSRKAVLGTLHAAKRDLGAEEVDVYGLNVNSHPSFLDILADAAALFDRVAVKSQRLDELARRPELWRAQKLLGKRMLTAGVEGISTRLRRLLAKRLSDGDLDQALDLVLKDPPGELKLFFVLTGLESDADLRELDTLGRGMTARLTRSAGRCRVVWSFTPLHVAPHTPLAFRGSGPDPSVLKPIRQRIEEIARRHGIEVRIAERESELVPAQLLATGDRRVTPALCRAFVSGDEMYDDSLTANAGRRLLDELAAFDLRPDNFLFERAGDAALPWDDISAGVAKRTLAQVFARITSGDEAAQCFADPTSGDCMACSICATPVERRVLRRKTRSAGGDSSAIETALAARQDPARLHVLIDIEPRYRYVPPAFWPRAVARALMLSAPALVDSFLGPDDLAEPPVANAAGHRWVALRFRRDADLSKVSCATGRGELAGACIVETTTHRPEPPQALEVGLDLPGVSPATLAAAVQAPGSGRTLPLTLTRKDGVTRLVAAGDKARRSPVQEAEIQLTTTGAHASVRCRPGYDLQGVLTKAYANGRTQLRAATVTVRFAATPGAQRHT
jgi:radical SAM superfamily enzyme YgiQ (UPF0313 family)